MTHQFKRVFLKLMQMPGFKIFLSFFREFVQPFSISPLRLVSASMVEDAWHCLAFYFFRTDDSNASAPVFV
jgi:hypothetical protein